MDDEGGPVLSGETAGTDEGTGAVLYGMFTSFAEVLGNLEGRLAAIESAVRSGPPELDRRLAGLDDALARLSDLVGRHGEVPTAGDVAGGQGAEVAALADLVRRQSELVDQRTAALQAAVDAVRALLQAHADETANSLGRRAGDAGRRLANDLGLRGRPKPPSPNP